MKGFVRFTLIAALAAVTPAMAANMYTCKDAKGKPYAGLSIPPECQGLDVKVINEKGNIVEIIEGEVSRAKTLAREAEEAAAMKVRNEQMQRDRMLLETYLTVADLERLRDQRLELLEAQLKVTEQHISTLSERMDQLKQQAARFKPYSDQANAPPLPDHIAEAIVGTLRSVAVDRETMQIKKNEQAELSANFERDIKRFKELKSLK